MKFTDFRPATVKAPFYSIHPQTRLHPDIIAPTVSGAAGRQWSLQLSAAVLVCTNKLPFPRVKAFHRHRPVWRSATCPVENLLYLVRDSVSLRIAPDIPRTYWLSDGRCTVWKPSLSLSRKFCLFIYLADCRANVGLERSRSMDGSHGRGEKPSQFGCVAPRARRSATQEHSHRGDRLCRAGHRVYLFS